MLSDLRFAFRSLAKTPGFTAIALLTLALGIGVNTTMFTVINTVLFQRLAFAEPERLVRVFRTSPHSQRWPHSAANFTDLHAQAKSFDALAVYNGTNSNYSEPGQPAERLRGMAVTADFFPMLGVNPELGRTFSAEELNVGGPQAVILSHALWARKFNSDTSIVGKQIRIDGQPVTVVGVMPARFNPPLFWGLTETWRPLVFTAEQQQNRDHNYLAMIGRLAPGVTAEQAQGELAGLAARFGRDFPQSNAGNGLRTVPLASAEQADAGRRLSWLVMALAGFVLLIACANLANLQFARTTGRARDYAIRLALGAARGRIMQELLVESLLLSFVGGGLGLLLATWSNELLASQINNTPGFSLPLDWRVFGFAFLAAVLAGLCFGLMPAWLAARSDVNDTLKSQARGSTVDRSQHRLRHSLIVVEMALALILLTGAAVFVRGLQRFTTNDPGWRPDNLLGGNLTLPASRYADEAAQGVFLDKLTTALAANPAFSNAGVSSSLPIRGYSSSTSAIPEGRPDPTPGQEPLTNIVQATPSYFTTMGVPLLQGRLFAPTDKSDAPKVAIINESLAKSFWPGESPIGRRIGSPDPNDRGWREVVGVVGDMASPGQLNTPDTRFQMYVPLAQEPSEFLAVVVQGRGSADLLGEELRRTITAIDPDQPVYGLNPLRVEIDRALGEFTFIGRLLTGFAGLGLLLAALGIYGVLSGFVAQRRAEIGVRMALGAQVRDVLGLVLRRGLSLALLGIAVGLLGAFGVVRLLGRILPELGSPDVLTLAGIVVALLAVAFFACFIPARRASRVDPLEALRTD